MTEPLSPPAPLRPQPGVVARRLGDGSVLVHLPTNRIFELNETGARVWELLVEGHDVAAVVARLTHEFDVDETTARQEVEATVARLQREGLVEP